MKLKFMIIFICLASATLCAFAADKEPEMVKVDGKGVLTLVASGNCSIKPLTSAAKNLEETLQVNLSVTNVPTWNLSNADKLRNDLKATVAIFTTDDAALPISLIALESRWACVNTHGLTEKAVCKEVMRVTLALLSANSPMENSILYPAVSAADLEKCGDSLSFDVVLPALNGMGALGLEAYTLVPKE